LKDKK